jgi:hypothetical protein
MERESSNISVALRRQTASSGRTPDMAAKVKLTRGCFLTLKTKLSLSHDE